MARLANRKNVKQNNEIRDTSRLCAYHDVEVKRKPRGVIHCPFGHKIHSDLNGALNIMKKATGKIINVIKKPLSFIVGHNGVAPVKGITLKTPAKPSPLRTGGGQRVTNGNLIKKM